MSEQNVTTPAFDPASRTMIPGPDRESAAPPADDPRIGSVLKGSYRLERLLGEGGMGAVYLAEHITIHKKVAIKILGQEYAHRPELKERFLREARAAAAISDDHVIEIHDFGDTPDGSAFFVMEYLHGHDLADVIATDAPLPWSRARDICVQICRALQAAHERGIVHRDMKPANCFRLDRPGRDVIKVLDFGIAKFQNPDESVGQALTRTGMIFGTPEYMSPEQAQGRRHDHRVDIYAVGVILFEMLTGRAPFVADTFMGILNQHMFEAPPRPADVAPGADIPDAAEAVVLKALQKDPELRFQTMAQMIDALHAVDAGVAPQVVPEALGAPPAPGAATPFRKRELAPTIPPPPAPSRRWPAVAALLAALVAGLVVVIVTIVQERPDMVEPPAPAPQRAPDPAPPPPVAIAEPPQDPPPPATVAITFASGDVVAQILDHDGALLGSTAEPLDLPRASTERTLRLRADGFDELIVKTIPSEDRTLTVTLTRKPEPGKKPPKTGKTGKTDPKVETKADTKPPDTKTRPPGSPDLISPFGN